MFALINRILDWFKSLFWKEEMELTLVGLQYSGKTTFVNVIASGQFSEDMIPTVGFNMRKITKGNVTIKLWDIGGQPRFRSMWERYCRGVNAIVWVSSWEIRNLNHNLFRFITLMISVVYRQLHGWRGRPGQNRGFPQRAPSLAGQTAAGRNTSSGAWKQKRSSQRSRWERPHRKDEPIRHSRPWDLLLFNFLQRKRQYRYYTSVADNTFQIWRESLIINESYQPTSQRNHHLTRVYLKTKKTQLKFF